MLAKQTLLHLYFGVGVFSVSEEIWELGEDWQGSGVDERDGRQTPSADLECFA